MQREKLNSPNGHRPGLARFFFVGVGVSTLLCLPIFLNGLMGQKAGTDSAQQALTTEVSSASNAGFFGMRGPIPSESLVGQSGSTLNVDPLKDTDGDLLPDVLEWSLLSDPLKKDTDGDGISDFVEAVEFTSPIEKNQTGPAVDSYRVLFATTQEGKLRSRYLWVHSLIRLASGNIKDLRALNLFLDYNGSKVDLTSLFYTNTKEIKVQSVSSQGLLIRIAVRFPMPKGFEKLAPGSFASHALVNSNILTASAQMFYLNSAFHTLSLVNSKAMILQTSGAGEARTTFWTSGQACVLTLEIIGSSPGWRICEVKKAACKVVYRGNCSPSCLKSTGAAVLVADGTPLIEGG